ncbi:MAG: hypothetical protein ACTH3D_12630 [Halomonas sp.]|uniref:hypothetical protein n=1 Tax=Halomonas sp. TaxID=1486246 RepID=UPI003F932EC2
MTTIDLTLHGESASDLACYLRAVAEQFDTEGQATLPPAGHESPVRVNDALVGTVAVPGRLSFEDAANLASAERIGNISTLDQAHAVLLALVSVLRNTNMPLAHRNGLLIALDIIAAALNERQLRSRGNARGGRRMFTIAYALIVAWRWLVQRFPQLNHRREAKENTK